MSKKPTIEELEKKIGTPNELEIMPDGSVQPKYPKQQPTAGENREHIGWWYPERQEFSKTDKRQECAIPVFAIEETKGNEQQPTAGEPKCKTCGDRKLEIYARWLSELRKEDKVLGHHNIRRTIGQKCQLYQMYVDSFEPCPDCQQLPEGEFTKKVKSSVRSRESIIAKITDIEILAVIGWIPQLCDRLDRAKAEIKQFEACCEQEKEVVAQREAKLKDLEAIKADLLTTLEQSKEIFSKKLRSLREKQDKAEADLHFIERRYWSGVWSQIFELRQEIEQMLAIKNLNEFCILMAFMPEEKREATIAKAEKEG